MSRVRADEIANRLNTGCPDLVHGAVITGVCSATTFVGGLTGDATGLSGTPNISVANIQAGIVTFTGDLSVGGTITHEDVTNIDSVGIVTGRLGYNVVSSGASIFSPSTNVLTLGTQAEERARIDADGKLLIGTTTEGAGAADDLTVASSGNCGITIRSGTTSTGNLYFSDATSGAGEYDGFIEHNHNNSTLSIGVGGAAMVSIKAGEYVDFADGGLIEHGNVDTSTSLTGEFDFLIEDGNVWTYTAATGGNFTPDFKVSSSTSFDTAMGVGDVITCSLFVASSSHYVSAVKIDNSTTNVDTNWVGGSAPSSAGGSGYDAYTFIIVKTAATPAYLITANVLASS